MKIKGKEVSEETIAMALKGQFGFVFEEPYQFQAGDVIENEYGSKRIIVNFEGSLLAFDEFGKFMGRGQEYFERYYPYKKIGELKDFIK